MPVTDERSARVLLVDGTGTLEDRFGTALANAGFGVTTVGSASDCLRRVSDGDVDGIVSRYDLPDLDGIRLLRSVRLSFPLLPFVLVPDDGTESLAGEAVAAGANGYVPGDSDPDTVVRRLRNSLQQASGGGDEPHHRYRHLIEMSPAPINVFDETGESVWCNEAVLDLLDLDSRSELIGHSIFEFVHPDDHDLARRELETVTESEESTGPTRMRLRTADGAVKYINVSTAIGNYLGTNVGQAIIVDFTEQEERNRQLQVLEQWLRHNIRNEMTVIHGMAESIQRGQVDDVTEYAGRIRDHAARLMDQANHEREVVALLTSRPEPVPLDLPAVVERGVATCRETYPDADVEVERVADVTVSALPDVADAVTELVRNAVQHNDAADPRVSVEVDRNGDGRGVVRVVDDGPGIPERERNAVLIDREITPLDHGTGLGLVFAYWVARLSGGDLSFAENEPRGSVVTLTLPSAGAERAASADDAGQ